MLDRRSVLALAPLSIVIAGCVEDGAVTSPSASTGPSEATSTNSTGVPEAPGNRFLSPQVVYGPPSAAAFSEVAVSLHCGATRAFTRSTLRSLMAAAQAGQRTVVLTHYVRTENEIPLGVSLLQTGARYPEALLAMLGLSARLDRALSAAEATQFLTGAGFARDPRISDSDARLALGLARMAYDNAGVTGTPFIKQG